MNLNIRYGNRPCFIPLIVLALLNISFMGEAFAATVALDPYADIDWDTVKQQKANLHTHTTQSDGQMTPNDVIDEYQRRGFTILALTEHNLCTWPWTGLATIERKGRALQGDKAAEREPNKPPEQRKAPLIAQYEDRDPQALGMLAVAGNEPSIHHHMGAYFIQYETRSRVLEQTLAEVGEAGGMAMLFHPGRYWELSSEGVIPADVVSKYVSLFRQFDHLFGVEVINQGMRYKNDVQLWDKILMELMPDRPVWGYANNDMYRMEQLGRDWNIFLINELEESRLRDAMKRGCSYFCTIGTHEESLRNVDETPVIQSIVHDSAAGTLTITATSGGSALPQDKYRWISAGNVVHTGSSIDYKNMQGLGNYLRAELTGSGGTTFTNPYCLAE